MPRRRIPPINTASASTRSSTTTASTAFSFAIPLPARRPSPRPQFTTSSNLYTFSLQGNETHTFSAHLLNEAFAGYNRIEGYTPNKGLFSVPVVGVTGLGVGFGDANAYEDYIQHGFHWRDVVTWVRGNHDFRIGYEGWHGDDLAYFAGRYSQPIFAYTNIINLINDNPFTETNIAFNPVTGEPFADNYGYAKTTGGAFVEDQWKVTSRLTVNYGLRYDNFGNAYPALAGTILANSRTAALFLELNLRPLLATSHWAAPTHPRPS